MSESIVASSPPSSFEGGNHFLHVPDTFANVTPYFTVPAATGASLLQDLRESRTATALSLFVLFLIARALLPQSKKLPTGVKRLPRLPGLPWAGRFWDVPGPGIDAALHFGALHKKYGPIYEWKVMGTTHIWLETDKVARDLFVLRQRKYCDRNILPAAMGVKEDCEILPLSGYSEDFRRHKNFIHSIMKHSTPHNFYGGPVIENQRTLRRLLESPDRWSEHMITHCARTIATVAWGDPEHGKKLLVVVPDLLKAVSPDGPIINKLTFLRHLPAWLSPWKKYEARRKQTMQDAFYEALSDVKTRMESGDTPQCWSTLWLNSDKGVQSSRLDWHEAAFAIGSASFVAIATIGGPLHAWFVALAHYPEWFSQLQEELDRVVGPDRLPTFEDVPQLPRLRATVKEILRWRQSTPLGVPHEALDDDVYEGHLIPKGAMLHANHYLISRDPEMYPRGNEFVPERWLDPSYPTYREPLTEFPNLRGDNSFGYGNRACPGVDLTYMELCTLFGALAWAFDITSPSPGGATDLPWYEVNKYVITMSKPFPITIRPRDEHKRQWILQNTPGDDPGYTLSKRALSRWDIVFDHDQPGAGKWDWNGLAPEFVPPKTPRVYPEGM